MKLINCKKGTLELFLIIAKLKINSINRSWSEFSYQIKYNTMIIKRNKKFR